MKKILIAATVGMLLAGQVAAQESPWLVRARVVHLDMANKDSVAGGALNLNVDNKSIPELDISYFFNKNVAAELILTVPQKQHVYSGSTDLGTFKHLPPTLLAQYHFTNFTGYKPYVGAGVNLTFINKESITTGTDKVTLSNDSIGMALQAGVDVPLTKQLSLNFDVKKVQLKTRVYIDGVEQTGNLKLNPVLVGVGIGYRF